MELFLKKVAGIIRRNKRRKWMKAGVMSAACIVVFVTTYALILPAIKISLDQASEMPGFDTAFSGELLDTDDGMEDGILSGDDGDTQGSGAVRKDCLALMKQRQAQCCRTQQGLPGKGRL